jgi:hypothetical protein
MESKQNGASSIRPTSPNIHGDASIYENEVYLIDYFKVAWKWKYLILFGAILPALAVGIILFFSPKNYKITYIYNVRDDKGADVKNWNLNKNNYEVLLDRFYRDENVARLSTKLQKYVPNQHVGQPKQRSIRGALKRLVTFQTEPSFTNIARMSRRNVSKFEQLRALKASLLRMTIKSTSEKDIVPMSLVIKGNFERTIPLYKVKDNIYVVLKNHKNKLLELKSERTRLNLELENYRYMVDRLRNFKAKTVNHKESDIALQFNIGSKVEYLPLNYQMQGIEIKIIRVEEEIRKISNECDYYGKLIALSEKLLNQIESDWSHDYTVQEFQNFLHSLVTECKDSRTRNYLDAYINNIENRMAATVAIRSTDVLVIPKAAARKAAIVFVMALMITIFAAFIAEGARRRV